MIIIFLAFSLQHHSSISVVSQYHRNTHTLNTLLPDTQPTNQPPPPTENMSSAFWNRKLGRLAKSGSGSEDADATLYGGGFGGFGALERNDSITGKIDQTLSARFPCNPAVRYADQDADRDTYVDTNVNVDDGRNAQQPSLLDQNRVTTTTTNTHQYPYQNQQHPQRMINMTTKELPLPPPSSSPPLDEDVTEEVPPPSMPSTIATIATTTTTTTTSEPPRSPVPTTLTPTPTPTPTTGSVQSRISQLAASLEAAQHGGSKIGPRPPLGVVLPQGEQTPTTMGLPTPLSTVVPTASSATATTTTVVATPAAPPPSPPTSPSPTIANAPVAIPVPVPATISTPMPTPEPATRAAAPESELVVTTPSASPSPAPLPRPVVSTVVVAPQVAAMLAEQLAQQQKVVQQAQQQQVQQQPQPLLRRRPPGPSSATTARPQPPPPPPSSSRGVGGVSGGGVGAGAGAGHGPLIPSSSMDFAARTMVTTPTTTPTTTTTTHNKPPPPPPPSSRRLVLGSKGGAPVRLSRVFPSVQVEEQHSFGNMSSSRPSSSSSIRSRQQKVHVTDSSMIHPAAVAIDRTGSSTDGTTTPATTPTDMLLSPIQEHILEKGRRSAQYSDVTLLYLGRRFFVHRLVLSRSPYFRQLLEEQRPGASSMGAEIVLSIDDPNITADSLDVILSMLYGASVDYQLDRPCTYPAAKESIHSSSVLSLLATAHHFQFPALVEKCMKFVCEYDLAPHAHRPLFHGGGNGGGGDGRAHTTPSAILLQYIDFVDRFDYGAAITEVMEDACLRYLCTEGYRHLETVFADLPLSWLERVLEADAFWCPTEFERYQFAKRVITLRRMATLKLERALAEQVETESQDVYADIFRYAIIYTHMTVGSATIFMDGECVSHLILLLP